ncbi:MAG: DUF4270 family protein [Bacteroidetes bacterium]|nr:MAG: DUF4270 family protein [Bacteroidota bacterium]
MTSMTFTTKFLQLNLSAWYRKRAFYMPLFLLMSLAMACQQNSTIGRNLVSQESAQIIETDTFTIEANSVLADSIVSDRTASEYLLVGQYNDPFFGKVKASSFVQIVPPSDPTKLPDEDASLTVTGRVIDSVVFVLGLQKLASDEVNIYPNRDAVQSFYVHRLTDTISVNKTYYTSDTHPYDPDPLAKVTVNTQKLKEDKFVRINLTTSTYTKGRALSDEIKQMIDGSVSSANFKINFKGFALVPDANSIGNVIGFADDVSTGISVHYTVKTKEAEGVPDKNTPKMYLLYTSAHFHNITVDRTGTPLAGFNTFWQPIPTTSTGGNALLQAGSAIYTRLSFPTLKNLKKLGNVVINKAVLTMKTTQNSTQTMPAPPYVFLYEAGSNGKLAYQTLNGFKQPVRVTLDGTSQTLKQTPTL